MGTATLLIAFLCLLAGCGSLAGGARDGPVPGACAQPAAVATLFRRVKTWEDYAQPLAVLQLGQPASALHYVPGAREAAPPRFLAAGDAAGGLHLLSPTGRLVLQHHTGTPSPVTAVGSYRLRRNATVLLTGHASGQLRLHLLEHQPAAAAAEAPTQQQQQQQQQLLCSAWEAEEEGCGAAPLTLSLLEAFAPAAVLCSTPPAAASCSAGQQAGTCAALCAPIAAVLGAGRGSGRVAATAVVVDALGRLAVLKHGGPTGAGARLVRQVALEQQPLALRPPTAAATAVLGSSGSASQRLGQPTARPAGLTKQPQPQPDGGGGGAAEVPPAGSQAPTFKPCRDLSSFSNSSMVAGAFDAQHASRAYALTADGQLLALVVGGEKGSHANCIVKAAAPLPAGLLPPNGGGDGDGDSKAASLEQQQQLALAAIPGYLLVVAGGQVSVFNASSAPRAAPRLLLQQQLAALRGQFGVAAAAPAATPLHPLLAASQQGHVALTLNASVLALYQTAFPFRAPLKAPMKGGLVFMQMLQPLAMVVVAAAVIYRARARRGSGEGGGGGGGRGFGGGLSADPRLREFERLLQDPMMASGLGGRRQRAASGGRAGRGGARLSGDTSGSDGEDGGLPPLGSTRPGSGSGSGGAAKRRTGGGGSGGGGGLFGRSAGGNGRGASAGGAGSREREALSRRAAALAAADDRETSALRAELAADLGSLGGEAEGWEEEEEEGQEEGAPLAGAFGSDIDSPLLSGGRRRSSAGASAASGGQDLSLLGQRFGQTRIS